MKSSHKFISKTLLISFVHLSVDCVRKADFPIFYFYTQVIHYSRVMYVVLQIHHEACNNNSPILYILFHSTKHTWFSAVTNMTLQNRSCQGIYSKKSNNFSLFSGSISASVLHGKQTVEQSQPISLFYHTRCSFFLEVKNVHRSFLRWTNRQMWLGHPKFYLQYMAFNSGSNVAIITYGVNWH